MGIYENAVIKLRQAEVICKLKEETLKSILNKYEVLATIKYGEETEDVLYNNYEMYSVILLPVVYRMIYNVTNSKVYNNFKGSVPKIDAILQDKANRDKFFGYFGKALVEHGVAINEFEVISEEQIVKLLDTFYIEDDYDIESDADSDENDYDIVDDDIEDDFDLDSIMDTSSTKDNAESENNNQLELLKRAWGDKLDVVISGIMKTYDRLYASGYGIVAPCGILTNIGAVRSATDGRVLQTGNKALDIEIFKAITSVLKDNYNIYAENDKEPDIFEIEKEGRPIIYVGMHLQFMFGHLRFCKGINKYISSNNINNESTTKMTKWSDMRGYIRERIEEYFYSAYIKYGITSESTDDEIVITNKINSELSKNLKNIIILAERHKGINTRVRIASDSNIDTNRVIRELQSQLNIGTDSSVVVKQVGDYVDGVLDINVIYNDRKFSQDMLFAYQVLDKLEEQGIRPRWDNVILGKKEDGTIMTYNFKDKRNAVYAIYAATGAGKGVMTLNIIASAIADMCKVLYIDGKPDMGEVIADLAWKNGVEAPVYNGVSGKGSEMLENRGTSIRRENPFLDEQNIPDGIFITEQEKEKYILISTYLRGIELICDIAASRSSQELPGNDWVTAFVDECEQAAVAEIDVDEYMNRAETKRKGETGSDGKKIDKNNDPIMVFIRNYRDWKQSIRSKFKTCITSTFRYSNMTMLFIWQSTKFPEQYKNKSVIAGVIDASAGVITKIFGRGAAVTYGSTAFGTPSSLSQASWWDRRFTDRGGGYFAIGKNVNSNEMVVFRPFNIYSDAEHKELIVENAKAVGISEDDLIGVSLDSLGNVIPEVGFEGYITKMLRNYGITVAEQLQSSYRYFDTFIRTKGFDNLNTYMFDCHNFNTDSKTKNNYFADKIIVDKEDDIQGFEEEQEEYNIEDSNTVDNSTVYNERQNDKLRRINEYRNRQTRAYNEEIEPEIEYVNSNVGVNKVDGKTVIGNDSGFSEIKIDKSNFVEPDRNSIKSVGKFKSKLMESSYGMNYNFKQRWGYILDTIESVFPRSNMITRIDVLYDIIIVNGKIVDISEMLDDEYGIILEDIVNFSEMLKRFKNVRELTVDSESFRWLTIEFSDSKMKIYSIFNIARMLQVINVDNGNGTQMQITRDGRNRDSADNEQRNQEFRQQIDQMSAGYNNRIDRKGSVYMDRISRKSFGFTKNNWGRVKNNFIASNGKRHIVRGTLWLGVAAITGTVGTIFLGGRKLMTAFGK